MVDSRLVAPLLTIELRSAKCMMKLVTNVGTDKGGCCQ